jgi:hypothetical protein
VNQDRARRHARWRLPAGVYNPIVTADGRRWRDYEQAAEAPAPLLEDRRAEVDAPRADALAAAVLSGLAGGVVTVNGAAAVSGPLLTARLALGGDADRTWQSGGAAGAERAEATATSKTAETAETAGEADEASAHVGSESSPDSGEPEVSADAPCAPRGAQVGAAADVGTGAVETADETADDVEDDIGGEFADDAEDQGFFDAILAAGGAADRADRRVSGGPVVAGDLLVSADLVRREPVPGEMALGEPVEPVPGRDRAPEAAAETGTEAEVGGEPFTKAEELWAGAFQEDDLDRDWLDRSCRPPRLEYTRPYGMAGGLAEPDSENQDSLMQAAGGRFPDPRSTWIRLINAEGPSEDPFRSNNAVDCALAVMSTWHGEPVVAARRQPEYDPSGRPLLTGETGGVTRAEEWLGHRFEYVGHGRRAYIAIAQRLIFGGHGAAAVLITRWPGGGSHAWNAVNCRGEVLWIDAQRGHMAVEPPYEDVTGVFCVVIDREGQRL